MNIFIYGYHILFSVLFAVVTYSSLLTYKSLGKRFYLWLSLTFAGAMLEGVFAMSFDVVTNSVTAAALSTGAQWFWYALFALLKNAENLMIILCLDAYATEYEHRPKRSCAPLYALLPVTVAVEVVPLFWKAPLWQAVGKSVDPLYMILMLCFFVSPWQAHSERFKKFFKGSMAFLSLALVESGVYLLFAPTIDRLFPDYAERFYFSIDLYYLLFSLAALRVLAKERNAHHAAVIETVVRQRVDETVVKQPTVQQLQEEEIARFGEVYALTRRELDILQLVLQGESNLSIANQLFITEGTVKAHLHSIFQKAEVSRRSQLMSKVLQAKGR